MLLHAHICWAIILWGSVIILEMYLKWGLLGNLWSRASAITSWTNNSLVFRVLAWGWVLRIGIVSTVVLSSFLLFIYLIILLLRRNLALVVIVYILLVTSTACCELWRHFGNLSSSIPVWIIRTCCRAEHWGLWNLVFTRLRLLDIPPCAACRLALWGGCSLVDSKPFLIYAIRWLAGRCRESWPSWLTVCVLLWLYLVRWAKLLLRGWFHLGSIFRHTFISKKLAQVFNSFIGGDLMHYNSLVGRSPSAFRPMLRISARLRVVMLVSYLLLNIKWSDEVLRFLAMSISYIFASLAVWKYNVNHFCILTLAQIVQRRATISVNDRGARSFLEKVLYYSIVTLATCNMEGCFILRWSRINLDLVIFYQNFDKLQISFLSRIMQCSPLVIEYIFDIRVYIWLH